MIKPLLKKRILFSIIAIDMLLVLVLIKFSTETALRQPLGDTIQVSNTLHYQAKKYSVYGYLPYWMLENAEYIQYDKLTDIAYFGIYVDTDGTILRINDSGETDPGYNNWKNNKTIPEIIKKSKASGVNFALGIVAQTDDNIDAFLNCRDCWNVLLDETIVELESKGIKDVNVDFEHAELTTTEISDLYTQFIEFYNNGLDNHFKDQGGSRVVVASFADSYKRSRITNPTELAKVVDGIFIMAYDFHSTSSDKAGPVAPMGGYETRYDYDVPKAIADFKAYVSPLKLIMGVPYYGYNFLINENNPDTTRVPGSDAAGYTVAQSYAVIKDADHIPSNNYIWDDVSKTPYVIYTSEETGSLRVLHFENSRSLSEKYAFVKREKLQGVGIWALGYDGAAKELWEELGKNFR